jgi:hypothetical protein
MAGISQYTGERAAIIIGGATFHKKPPSEERDATKSATTSREAAPVIPKR